jgi:NADH-quinone oxidoreductase subunit C
MSEELLAKVGEVLGEAVLDSHAAVGDVTILVQTDRIVEVMETLRDHADLRFNFLMDLTAVDYLGREPRFEVVYHLASIEEQTRGSEAARLFRRLRVKIGVPEEPCEAPSVVGVWPAANWMEREVWDLYGISFKGHPDPRRILLYEQFKGHPLRKDYPKERRQPLVGPRN